MYSSVSGDKLGHSSEKSPSLVSGIHNSLSLSLSLSLSIYLSLYLTLSHTLSLIRAHIHMKSLPFCVYPSHTHLCTHTHTHTHTLSLSLSPPRAHATAHPFPRSRSESRVTAQTSGAIASLTSTVTALLATVSSQASTIVVLNQVLFVCVHNICMFCNRFMLENTVAIGSCCVHMLHFL